MDFSYSNCWDCPVSFSVFVGLAATLFLVAIFALWLRTKGYRVRPLANGLLILLGFIWVLQFGPPARWGIIPFRSGTASAALYGADARAVLLVITVAFAVPLALVAWRLTRRPN